MLQCFLNIYNYFYLKYSVISFTESISLKIMQLLAIFWDYFPQTVSLANQTKAGREKRRRVQVQAQWGQETSGTVGGPVKVCSVISSANSFRVTSPPAKPVPPSLWVSSSGPPAPKVRVTWLDQVHDGIVTRGFWARCLGTRRRPSACGRASRCCVGWRLAACWRSRSSSERRSRPDGRRHSVTLVPTRTAAADTHTLTHTLCAH